MLLLHIVQQESLVFRERKEEVRSIQTRGTIDIGAQRTDRGTQHTERGGGEFAPSANTVRNTTRSHTEHAPNVRFGTGIPSSWGQAQAFQ